MSTSPSSVSWMSAVGSRAYGMCMGMGMCMAMHVPMPMPMHMHMSPRQPSAAPLLFLRDSM